MATGLSGRAANLARLQADKRLGRPVAYRPIPGNPRRYYNPRTGEEATEHYVVRVYRPSLSQAERNYLQNVLSTRLRNEREQSNSLADTWIARQEALGNPITTRNAAKKDAEFKELYRRFKIVSYNARHIPISDENARSSAYASDGEYAQLLVLLGRRLPDEAFPVGESAKQVGSGESYIDNVVLPALRSMKEK